jgi:hypothetical protein
VEGSGREEEDEEGRLMNWQERSAVGNVPIEVLDLCRLRLPSSQMLVFCLVFTTVKITYFFHSHN